MAPAHGRRDAHLTVDITHCLPRGVYRLQGHGKDWGTLDARNPLDPRWDGRRLHFETHPYCGDTLGYVDDTKTIMRVRVTDDGQFAVSRELPTEYNSVRRKIGSGTWTVTWGAAS